MAFCHYRNTHLLVIPASAPALATVTFCFDTQQVYTYTFTPICVYTSISMVSVVSFCLFFGFFFVSWDLDTG